MSLLRTRLQIRPILAALRRHKMATALIVLQIALTLAVVSNALFIVKTRVMHLSRPTGIDEAHLFVIKNEWIGHPDAAHIDAQMRADLATLRNLPGVRDAFASQAYPFGGWGGLLRIKHQVDQTRKPQFAISYFADQHALDTFGLALVAGRNFRADEISSFGPYDKLIPAVIIITRDLADKLFPDRSALGKTIYLSDDGPSIVVGIVDRLEGAYVGSTTRSIDEDTVLVPSHYDNPDGVIYLVRTQPQRLPAVMHAASTALFAQNRMRLISPDDGVIALVMARAQGYATDRGVAIMMEHCLRVALAGDGRWHRRVEQLLGGPAPRRSIGVRRALGATRGDILRYFQTENFHAVVGGGMSRWVRYLTPAWQLTCR